MALLEGRLVDIKFVRIDRALHDIFTQAVGTGDKNHIAEPGFGIQRKHHAAGIQIGAHHFHDAYR